MWINEDTGTHSEVSCDNGRDESFWKHRTDGQTQEELTNSRGKLKRLKELLFGLETAKPTEEAEFEEKIYTNVKHASGRFGGYSRREALFMSRHAKNIMKEAGMEMRKWISNDTVLMAQWAAEGFDTHLWMHPSRLGTNKTKVLGMKAWQTLDDCLTLDTKKVLLEFVSMKRKY
ncbi:hypothetical protein TNCV_2184421 [Trichonephila clavipes]|nr:hypothetical protein TNCV_2184421 [Trichonephila clavipes]